MNPVPEQLIPVGALVIGLFFCVIVLISKYLFKMKKVMFIAVMAMCMLAFVSAQNVEKICNVLPSKDGKVFYTEVINTEGVSSKELYANTKIWIANTFKSAKSVIQSDVEGVSIVIKGRLSYVTDGDSPFTLTVQFRDGRYRYELTDLIMDMNVAGRSIVYPIENAPFIKECNMNSLKKYNDFIVSFISKLKEGASVSNDW